MAPPCRLRNIEPCILYPFAEPHEKYYAAKKAWDDAHAKKEAADHHLDICLEKRKQLDREAIPLESGVRQSNGRVKTARAALLRADQIAAECDGRLKVADARYLMACNTLEEAQAALHQAEAGVGVHGKRQRSTVSDGSVVGCKSMRVGAESAGKAAARARPVGDVSAPIVIELDVESEKRLQACRLAADTAQEGVEHAQAKLFAVRAEAKTLRDHPDRAAGARINLEELERAAANDFMALEDLFGSAEHQKVSDESLKNATTEAAKAAAEIVRTERIKEKAEKLAYPHEFPEGGWKVQESNKRVNRVVPPPTPYVPPAPLEGNNRYSPSQVGLMILAQERKKAQAEQKRKARAAAKQRGAVRQSSRSTRGKPAAVFEA